MVIQCAWCKKKLGEKAPLTDGAVTHSICEACLKKAVKKNPPMDWIPAGQGRMERLVGGLRQAILEEKGVYALLQQTSERTLRSKKFGTKIEALAMAGIDAAKVLTGKNPGEAWHAGKMEEAERSEKTVKKPSLKDFYHGKAIAHFESALEERGRRRARPNPIGIFGIGNPPKTIHAKIEGVVYQRCIEVKAEKTGRWQTGFWKHPFDKKTRVQILALDNGDLLLHSVVGIKLWKKG